MPTAKTITLIDAIARPLTYHIGLGGYRDDDHITISPLVGQPAIYYGDCATQGALLSTSVEIEVKDARLTYLRTVSAPASLEAKLGYRTAPTAVAQQGMSTGQGSTNFMGTLAASTPATQKAVTSVLPAGTRVFWSISLMGFSGGVNTAIYLKGATSGTIYACVTTGSTAGWFDLPTGEAIAIWIQNNNTAATYGSATITTSNP